MSEIKARLFDRIFGIVGWFECNGILHIERSTGGYSGHWIAHPFCNKRLKDWVSFEEVQYAKTDVVCEECFNRFLKLTVADKDSKGAPTQ